LKSQEGFLRVLPGARIVKNTYLYKTASFAKQWRLKIIFFYASESILKLQLVLNFFSQATKSCWWMPWHHKAMKDVITCDMLRGAGIKL
jgi:hypothetical protein